jgi:hypothetical protein
MYQTDADVFLFENWIVGHSLEIGNWKLKIIRGAP